MKEGFIVKKFCFLEGDCSLLEPNFGCLEPDFPFLEPNFPLLEPQICFKNNDSDGKRSLPAITARRKKTFAPTGGWCEEMARSTTSHLLGVALLN